MPELVVIAGGICYIMDPDSQTPILIFNQGVKKTFVTSGGRNILVNDILLIVIEPDGKFWQTERISWDGLEDIEVNGNIVTGVAFNPTNRNEEWAVFSYNLDTKVLTSGSYTL